MPDLTEGPQPVFVVMVDDHNFELGVFPFTDQQRAVEFARQVFEENRPADGDMTAEELEEAGIGVEEVPGSLFSATYSEEGDSVWVLSRPLDQSPPSGGWPKCLYCTGEHEPRWLCSPAKQVLDTLIARGMEMNMPTLVFPEPIPMDQQEGLGQVDALVAQLVVMGATIEVAGMARPALMFTGLTAHGDRIPRYLYAGDVGDIRRAVKLVSDMAGLAIRNAAQANGGRRR